MKRLTISICASLAMTGGVALAQEFTKSRHIVPEPELVRPLVEQNSDSSWTGKFITAQNTLQLVNPLAPSTIWQWRASRGRGPARPT